MVNEKFYFPGDYFLGWRCIFCGEIIDQLILENRLGHTGHRRDCFQEGV